MRRGILFGLCILLLPVALALRAADAPKKAPIPDKAAQAKALALINDIFKEDLQAAQDPPAKSKLAAYLLQQGKESRDDPGNRYVLYREARDLAAKAGDAPLALLAIEEMVRDFDVNPLDMKAGTLATLAEYVPNKEAGTALVELLLPMIAEAVEADSYDSAIALGKVAEVAARKSKVLALVSSVQKRNEEVLQVQKGYARFRAFEERLKKDPADPEANLELGKYHALFKRRWEKALPLLAKGSDESLQKLAAQDLAKPDDAKSQLALADGWWERAGQEKDPVQLQLQRRAMHWYDKALGSLSGLSRTKALKRIDQVSARLSGITSDTPSGPVGELKKMEGHADEVKSVAMSNDGRYGVSGSVDQSVRVWDLATGKEDKLLRGHTKQVWGVAFHPNGRQVFSASWDASVRLWDIKSAAEAKRFTHRADVNGLALSRDGNTLASACDDHNVYLWNVSSGEEVRRLPGHTGFVYAVAFAPDGRHLASGGVDKTVRVYDLATGNQVKLFQGHSHAVTNVAFTGDSRHVLSAGDGVIRMWEVASGKETRRFEGHGGDVPAMAISLDGRRLLTGSTDKTIRLWDVATGKELAKLTGHTDTVTTVAFSSDGRRALSGSFDRTVRLWGLPPR